MSNARNKKTIDKETISVYDNQAEEYAALVKGEPHESLLAFIQQLAPKSYVLDLGCGPADASATMRQHGLRVDPVDGSTEMVRFANETYDIGARQATFSEIDVVDSYDAIWANFSLLHATRAEFPTILTALQKALKSGGWLHLAMKLGQGEARDTLGRFYTYYSEEELSNYLTNVGFTVEATRTGEDMSFAGVVEPWIMFSSRNS